MYFTDCHKFAIQSILGESISANDARIAAYGEMLKTEIKMVRPKLIVAFGKIAEDILKSITLDTIQVIGLPHFSGLAQGKIREYFNWNNDMPFTIEEQANCYYKTITEKIRS